jgi:hypothetical protein
MLVASVLTEALRDLWGPGLVFIVLCGWLVRRALRAARNESILEEQRMRNALGNPDDPVGEAQSPAAISPVPDAPQRFSTADVRGTSQEHLEMVTRLVAERESIPGARRIEVLWVRSTATHVAWAERRPAQREVICVAQIDSGKVVARWQFG